VTDEGSPTARRTGPGVAVLKDLLAGHLQTGTCEVEIGCGNGHFLASYARTQPGTLFVGVDIKAKRCRRAREKAEKRGLRNIQIVHGAAELFLAELPPRSVSAFHIYFPDPWPKSRHRKRRFFTMENLCAMHDRLQDGGRLHFGTDFFDYYIQAKVLTALHGGFRLGDEAAPEAVLTSIFGQKFVGEKKTIRIFTAVRVPSPDDHGQQDKDQGQVHKGVQGDERDRDQLAAARGPSELD
jgi:tRNA (guanine-N(7)-)-methyltransferase